MKQKDINRLRQLTNESLRLQREQQLVHTKYNQRIRRVCQQMNKIEMRCDHRRPDGASAIERHGVHQSIICSICDNEVDHEHPAAML